MYVGVGVMKTKSQNWWIYDSMDLGYTGFHGELEHLKIETRLIGESYECVMGECVI